MGVYNSSPSMGPCWSRDKGYHTPTTPYWMKPHMRAALEDQRKRKEVEPDPEDNTDS